MKQAFLLLLFATLPLNSMHDKTQEKLQILKKAMASLKKNALFLNYSNSKRYRTTELDKTKSVYSIELIESESGPMLIIQSGTLPKKTHNSRDHISIFTFFKTKEFKHPKLKKPLTKFIEKIRNSRNN